MFERKMGIIVNCQSLCTYVRQALATIDCLPNHIRYMQQGVSEFRARPKN
jgi:hypothetical protein